MSQVEEEKYLTNRAKVERIKAKVKIRFKGAAPRRCPNTSMISRQVSLPLLLALLLAPLLAGLSGAAPAAGGRRKGPAPSRPSSGGSSELSFEYLALRSVPSEQLCSLMEEADTSSSRTASNQVNLV